METIKEHLAKFKSRYQKITLLIMVVCPLLMFFGIENEFSTLIILSLIFIAIANILAIINK